MKIRSGFVSNSSTASFIVKTRPTEWDILTKCLGGKVPDTIKTEVVELLKKCGFKPSKFDNPFKFDDQIEEHISQTDVDIADDSILRLWMVCNHDYCVQFLVANKISFKASIHYGDYLYAYEAGDKYIYVLRNFGTSYLRRPKDIEKEMKNHEEALMDDSPFRKIKVTDSLKGYDEEEAIFMMTGKDTD